MKVALALGLVASIFAVSAALAPASGSKPATPPGGVYTCGWIAANPTSATLARVSCSPDMVNPGSSVSPSEAATLAGPDSVDSNGCQAVPSSGYIGHNVWAATSYQYTTAWSWTAGSAHETFTWYIKKTDDTTQVWGFGSGDVGDDRSVPANVYRWKVQNTGADPQNWGVCYSDF